MELGSAGLPDTTLDYCWVGAYVEAICKLSHPFGAGLVCCLCLKLCCCFCRVVIAVPFQPLCVRFWFCSRLGDHVGMFAHLHHMFIVDLLGFLVLQFKAVFVMCAPVRLCV